MYGLGVFLLPTILTIDLWPLLLLPSNMVPPPPHNITKTPPSPPQCSRGGEGGLLIFLANFIQKTRISYLWNQYLSFITETYRKCNALQIFECILYTNCGGSAANNHLFLYRVLGIAVQTFGRVQIPGLKRYDMH